MYMHTENTFPKNLWDSWEAWMISFISFWFCVNMVCLCSQVSLIVPWRVSLSGHTECSTVIIPPHWPPFTSLKSNAEGKWNKKSWGTKNGFIPCVNNSTAFELEVVFITLRWPPGSIVCPCWGEIITIFSATKTHMQKHNRDVNASINKMWRLFNVCY